jgi:hypothetical protein
MNFLGLELLKLYPALHPTAQKEAGDSSGAGWAVSATVKYSGVWISLRSMDSS